jgi:hypothetical protein
MPHRETTRPLAFLFLVLPYGISSSFVSITLPFVARQCACRLHGGAGWLSARSRRHRLDTASRCPFSDRVCGPRLCCPAEGRVAQAQPLVEDKSWVG